MGSVVAVILKIMPNAPDADLEAIKKGAQEILETEGAQNISFTEEPVAFGLKAIMMKMAWPEEKSTDLIEEKAATVENVSSAQVTDYRRAFG